MIYCWKKWEIFLSCSIYWFQLVLIAQFPDAQIVITDDADWISVLNEVFQNISSSESKSKTLIVNREMLYFPVRKTYALDFCPHIKYGKRMVGQSFVDETIRQSLWPIYEGVVTSYDDHATSDGELTVTGKRNPNTSHNAVTSGIYTSGCLYPYHEPTYDTASILHSSSQSILHRRTSGWPHDNNWSVSHN